MCLGIRWDKYLPVRTADSPSQLAAEVAAEEAAKLDLQRQHEKQVQPSAADDSHEMHFLPLQLKPAQARTSSEGLHSAEDQSPPAQDHPEGQESILSSLRQVIHASQQQQQESDREASGGREGAKKGDDADSGETVTDQAPWTTFNDSSLTPLIPQPVMWLVAEAEALLRNDSWFNLDVALDLSHLQSIAYCHFPNVAAWNCSRCGFLSH